MSVSLNRAAELAELIPPPSIGRTQQFLSEVSGPSQSFAQSIVQSRAPMSTIGVQTQSFSDQIANPVSRMLPASSPAVQDPYASRRTDIQEFTRWLDRREAVRGASDGEPAQQSLQAPAEDLNRGVVVKPSVSPVMVQAVEPVQAVSAAPPPPEPSPEPAAPAPTEHWLDRSVPVALRRVWTTNLALGSYMLGGMGGGSAAAASPLAAGLASSGGMLGNGMLGGGGLSGGLGNFELLNHMRFVRSTLEALPVAPEQVPFTAAAAFHQAVPTHALIQTLSAGAADRQAILDQLTRYGPNMIGLVSDTRANMGGVSKDGFISGPFSSPMDGVGGYSAGPMGGYGVSPVSGAPFADSPYAAPAAAPGFAGGSAPSYGSLPTFSRGPIASMPSFHSAIPLAAAGAAPPIPAEMTGPEYGQVTFASPPAQVASPDLATGGSAVAFSPASLARGSSPLDSSSLSSLSSSMPGAQMFYPALSAGSLPPGATNIPLSGGLVQQMLAGSAGAAVPPTLAESIAAKGAAAGSGGGSAGPASFQLVPSGTPAPGASGLFGGGGKQALDQAGGQSGRGGPMDFMGVPVRLAPSLAGKSNLASEQAVHQAVNKTADGPMNPQQFQLLRSKLFPSTTAAHVEPNSSAWQQAAAAHGLRSASPEALMAPDARLKPLSATAPMPQVEGGAANLKNIGLSPEIARMPPLTPSRIASVNRATPAPGAAPPGSPRGLGAGAPMIGAQRIGAPSAPLAGTPPLSQGPLSPRNPAGAPGGPASASSVGPAAGKEPTPPGLPSGRTRSPFSPHSPPAPIGLSGPAGPTRPFEARLPSGPAGSPPSGPKTSLHRLASPPPLGAAAGKPPTPAPPPSPALPPAMARGPFVPPTLSRPPIGLGAGRPSGSTLGSPTRGPFPSLPRPTDGQPGQASGATPPGSLPPFPDIRPSAGEPPRAPQTALPATPAPHPNLTLTPTAKGGPMDSFARPPVGPASAKGPASASPSDHWSLPPGVQLPKEPTRPAINLDLNQPKAPASPPQPGISSTTRSYRLGPSQGADNRPQMNFRTPPPKSSGPASTKTIIQREATMSGSAGGPSTATQATSSNSSEKRSGGNDVDRLVTEVWTILQRRLAFEAVRAGRR